MTKAKRKAGRMGYRQYARLLGAVAKQPATAAEVVERLGRRIVQATRDAMHRMASAGIMHIVEWRQAPSGRSYLRAAFKAGPGVNAPYPLKSKMTVPGARVKPRPEMMAFIGLIRALQEGATRAELHDATGISTHRISGALRELRAQGLLHTCGYEPRDGASGCPSEILRFGPGANAARPAPLSDSEKKRRYVRRRAARMQQLRFTDAISGRSTQAANSAAELEAA